MATVNQCCCGCSLRTGTLILLILSAIGGLSELFQGITVSFQANTNVENSNASSSILFGVITLCVSVVGLFGVIKRSPLFLLPYLIVEVITMVFFLIIMILLAVVGTTVLVYIIPSPQISSEQTSGAVAVIVFSEIVFLITEGILYYFFLVVFSYYKKLKAEN